MAKTKCKSIITMSIRYEETYIKRVDNEERKVSPHRTNLTLQTSLDLTSAFPNTSIKNISSNYWAPVIWY